MLVEESNAKFYRNRKLYSSLHHHRTQIGDQRGITFLIPDRKFMAGEERANQKQIENPLRTFGDGPSAWFGTRRHILGFTCCGKWKKLSFFKTFLGKKLEFVYVRYLLTPITYGVSENRGIFLNFIAEKIHSTLKTCRN